MEGKHCYIVKNSTNKKDNHFNNFRTFEAKKKMNEI